MDLFSPALGTIFWQAVVFFLALAVLSRYGWQPLLALIQQREMAHKAILLAQAEALEACTQLEKKNAALQQEGLLIREQLLEEGKQLREQLVATAHNEAQATKEQLLQQARAEVASTYARANEAMQEQVITLAVSIAEKLLHNQLTAPELQQFLAKEAIANNPA